MDQFKEIFSYIGSSNLRQVRLWAKFLKESFQNGHFEHYLAYLLKEQFVLNTFFLNERYNWKLVRNRTSSLIFLVIFIHLQYTMVANQRIILYYSSDRPTIILLN